ncbi:ribosomal protein S18-alanine N-acetyltransferase [Ferrimonas balearica]|uniref:ribosomal protein S18-alanine N-acetyltransferase n=1 Tax=Ferrimonas balearica TaxID=44012 RepID=UPI001C9909EA|nr:ribosomal protein S18-alanine N-acetyltransferase [Ferrimonas balearica]MBY5921514.1 ribosomal protein S18-alanine N-acetyltransferase [Ferrimonas balearica]MBY5995801.1 ribosomal protein S18-alanine N-acetyltransferase [Ferrimonas balearica]
MALSFQKAADAPFEVMWRIEQTAHAYPWSESLLRSCLTAPYWGELASDEEPVGFYLFQQVLDEVTLMNICVDPAQQGKGFGREILTRALEQAREAGAVQCFLEVRASNLAALTLYQKMGFAEDGRRKGYYPTADGREDAVLMSRALT